MIRFLRWFKWTVNFIGFEGICFLFEKLFLLLYYCIILHFVLFVLYLTHVDMAIYAPISRMSEYKYTEFNYSLITARLVCRVTGQVVKLGESTTVENSAIFKTQWKLY